MLRIATALALLAPAAAQASTLCSATETVLFSCPAGARIISICGAKDLNTIQYRFGKPGHIDLATPTDGTKANTTAGTLMYSGGGGAWMRFTNGAYHYTVFTAIGKWGPNESPASAAGVAVDKDGAPVANLPCTAPEQSQLGPDLFDTAHIAADPNPDGFEIPEAFLPSN
jgi:hypothetical protein